MSKTSEDKERDAKKLALAIMFVFSLVVSSIVGFGFGQFDMQKQAVQHGHADFIIDKNNNMVFKWRVAR